MVSFKKKKKEKNNFVVVLKHLLSFNFNPYISNNIKIPQEVLKLMKQQTWVEDGPSGNFQMFPTGIICIRRRLLSLLSVLLT